MPGCDRCIQASNGQELAQTLSALYFLPVLNNEEMAGTRAHSFCAINCGTSFLLLYLYWNCDNADATGDRRTVQARL